MMNFEQTFIGKASTKRSQLSLWRHHVLPHINVPDSRLNDAFIRELMNKWTNLTPGTQKNLLSIVKRYVLWKCGKTLDLSYLIRVLNRQQPEVEKPIWTKVETKRALNMCFHINKPLYEVLNFAVHTGCRISEVLGMRGSDIDLQNKTMLIRRFKTNKISIVPIHPSLIGMLEGLVANNSSLIFKQSNPNRALKKLCKLANVPEVTSHSFKHQFITRALDADLSPKLVADLVGTRPSTVMNVYWRKTISKVHMQDLRFLDD